jgi:hypothetical protein
MDENRRGRHGLLGHHAGEENGIEGGDGKSGGVERLFDSGGRHGAGGFGGINEVPGRDAIAGKRGARGYGQLGIQLFGRHAASREGDSGSQDANG